MCKVFTIALFFVCATVSAQERSAAHEFFDGLADCAASLGGWKCLELDLSSEVVEEKDSTKFYEYSWDFGDGRRQQGPRIEHCYEEFGSYQVTMDLLDTETNTVIRNELSATVHLYPEIFPAINVIAEDQAPGFLRFSYNDKDDETFVPDRVFWKVDGSFYEGNSIAHSFPVAGTYLVEMGVEKDMGFLGSVSACAAREVTIKDSDVWTLSMREAVQQKRTQLQVGPFATDEIFCRITNASAPGQKSSVIALASLMGQAHLQEESEYELLLFSGNILTEKARFSTVGLSGNNLYNALKDTVTALFRESLTVFGSLRYDADKNMVDTQEIGRIAALLLQHPHFEIALGSYVHSGSRLSKGVENSILRSQAVKKALVEAGVSPDRITVASPEYHQSLINTCSALPDCNWEDESLNGKVEIKIIGCL